ncbi:hypothetical protein AB0A63_31550 [Lentzea sp. NPDC042327]|uniref:hypothetical protein n=1 Tax=Lentzea sp. NPDC042327 TaxID=3154801 RepID=UPI0033D64C31
MADSAQCDLEEGVAVLRLLLDGGAPASPKQIAARLDLELVKISGALSTLRAAGFVELLPHIKKYRIAMDVLDRLDLVSRPELRLPAPPRKLTPAEVMVMDAVAKARYCAEVEDALLAACEEQGRVMLPTVRVLALHFCLSIEWASTVQTLLLEKTDVALLDHAPCGRKPVRRAPSR